ncbi:DUF1684 domain-containing protein [Catellatospora citrea]|uniref:DUF1684 domain-containing protein n=1 Tax=Catellatospora citrea TaxID=53366 RepID=A0A8J3NX71_9ACTN|nr:DUF1684 domain-containing protein [Catellatospora citrea]RKE12665.1 hypothetical protein C8E86_7607 [Catellatospora citrea]GIF96100.1 hypothetical protein Cci01nite_11940 [Catellatospora citrea]
MTTVEDTLAHDWQVWHAAREETLREPHGWLSLTALHWLTAEPTAYLSVPGRWHADDAGVHITATPVDGLHTDGALIKGTVTLTPREGAPGLPVTFDDKLVEVVLRTGRHGIRLRDPQSPTLTGFRGVPAFPVDHRWVVPATFEQYAVPRRIVGAAVVDGLEHHHSVRGVLRFAVDGGTYGLLAFDGGPGRLSVLFRDATSGVTTHGGVRSVVVADPGGSGPAIIDFNRAVNLPCAFTDYGTCPLPPRENVLPLAVEAGERKPHPVGR